MMKKHVLLLAGALFALCGYRSSVVPTEATGEKETILFDFTTERAMNDNVVALETDITLPVFSQHDFAWEVNGKTKNTFALGNDSSSTFLHLAWNGEKPEGDNGLGYRHFHLEAGTTIFSTDTADYVLRSDYNFWWTKHSAGGSAYGWVFQHGGNDVAYVNHEIPSLSFKGDIAGGVQAANGRWLAYLPYEKDGSWSQSANSWSANAVFIDDGSGYTLYDYTYSAEGYLKFADKVSSNTKGTLMTLILFSPFNTETGEDLDRYISFYFPKGTLLGGINEGYPFMVEEDAYFEISKEGQLSGMYTSPHDYVRVPASCGHPGNIEYYTCSRHGDEYFLKDGEKYNAVSSEDVLVDVEHTYSYVDEIPSTCDQDGMKAHYECSICHGLAIKEGEAYQAVSEEDLVIKAAHTLTHIEEKAFSCTENGVKAHEECSVCHKMYLDEDGELVEVSEMDLTIPSHHTLKEVDGKSATCLEEGKTSSKICEVCGEVIEESKIIPATGHRYSGWTLQEDSLSISRYCLTCYESEEVTLSEENGFVYTVEQEATETSKGLASYSSSKYGTFYVELPLKEKGINQTVLQSSIAGGVAVICISLSVVGFFLLRKKLH